MQSYLDTLYARQLQAQAAQNQLRQQQALQQRQDSRVDTSDLERSMLMILDQQQKSLDQLNKRAEVAGSSIATLRELGAQENAGEGGGTQKSSKYAAQEEQLQREYEQRGAGEPFRNAELAAQAELAKTRYRGKLSTEDDLIRQEMAREKMKQAAGFFAFKYGGGKFAELSPAGQSEILDANITPEVYDANAGFLRQRAQTETGVMNTMLPIKQEQGLASAAASSAQAELAAEKAKETKTLLDPRKKYIMAQTWAIFQREKRLNLEASVGGSSQKVAINKFADEIAKQARLRFSDDFMNAEGFSTEEARAIRNAFLAFSNRLRAETDITKVLQMEKDFNQAIEQQYGESIPSALDSSAAEVPPVELDMNRGGARLKVNIYKR